MNSSTHNDPGSGASGSEEGIYVYAFVDATRLDASPPLPDIDGSLALHPVGTIAAVIGRVAVAEFCGATGEKNLADPDWIMPRIRRHEAVVEAAMQWSPAFPAGFATLYTGLDSLTRFMRQHEAAIATFFHQVAGRQEWALKVSVALDDPATLEDLARELWPEWSDCLPGTRYLRLRRERATLIAAARARAAHLIPQIVAQFRFSGTAIRPLARAAAAHADRPLHVEDHALLAAIGLGDALHDRLRELTAEVTSRRLQITLSGPWPPYSFRPFLLGSCVHSGPSASSL